LTVPEVRRLLQVILIEDPAERQRHLSWSDWRRAHQAVARDAHMRRRASQTWAGLTPEPGIIHLPETVALSDERWETIVPLLPPHKPVIGRPAHDHRQILQGILWVARTGAPWRDLPPEFGPWETVHSRYRRWRNEGFWPRFITALHQPVLEPP
jgi:Putative transposase of IS4/5 family (DUF4096)